MGNSSGKPVVFTDDVNLNHFRLLRVVGKGAFGKVRIVERKDTGLTFALKYIRKDEIVRSESVRNIIRERRMLEQLQHPFLCNLRYSFQDMEYLYIVVDLMQGGDLRFHISRKTFTEEAVGFWMAELACALRYIHKKGIVHRDVKPDNILLDCDGHVHLADFNVASDFSPTKPLTSKSGTLAYLAPEAYEGRGYLSEVDWWSMGVTFYECIYNKRPFEGGNHNSLAARIVKANPPFPRTNPPVSMPCLHAISSLLEKDKRRRIGAAGFETFADNPFFRPLDFEALERKEIQPIFVPSPEKTNFDATYDFEELLLEEAPLEARAKRQKPRSALKHDATREEVRAHQLHQMIETMFLPYDYTRGVVPDDAKADLSLPSDADPSIVAHFTDSSVGKGRITPQQNQNLDDEGRLHSMTNAKQNARLQNDYIYTPTRGTPVQPLSPAQSPKRSPSPLASAEVQEYVLHPATSDPFPLPNESRSTSIRPHPSAPSAPEVEQLDQQQEQHDLQQQLHRHRSSQYQPIMPYDDERDLKKEMERQMDRVILSELDRADQQRSQANSPRIEPSQKPRPLSTEMSVELTGGRGTVVRHPHDKLFGHERLKSPPGSGRNSPIGHAGYREHSSSNATLPLSAGTSRPSTANKGTYVAGEEASEDRLASLKPTSVLRFLDRKRGRDRSPKGDGSERGEKNKEGKSGRHDDVLKKASGKRGKERERGVLGKEGARVIIANG